MFPELINFILITFLVMIQSILGIGVLVLGTPTLLLLEFSMLDTMNYLLPMSIITSLLNLIIIKIKKNSFNFVVIKLNFFFIICIPFVFIGLIILKNLHNFINFDFLVSFTIILTLFLRKKLSIFLKNLSPKLNKLILMIIGIIHGITNSGGTLLSIVLISSNKTKKKSRNEITLFYFFLALMQYILFYLMFGLSLNIHNYNLVIVYIVAGVVIGNILFNLVGEYLFQKMIYVLALITSISLILKNII